MRDYINVLDKLEITEVSWSTLGIIVAVLCAISGITVMLRCFAHGLEKAKPAWVFVGIGWLVIMWAASFVVGIKTSVEVPTGKYQYRVTVDDANFKQLWDDYDVIGQDGDVLIIREKEVE